MEDNQKQRARGGKSLLIQGFYRRPKGLGCSGHWGNVGEAGGHRQSVGFSPKAKKEALETFKQGLGIMGELPMLGWKGLPSSL